MTIKTFEPCFRCGETVSVVIARRGELVMYFDVKTHEPHECKEENLPGRCPGPAFCEDIDCDYCNLL